MTYKELINALLDIVPNYASFDDEIMVIPVGVDNDAVIESRLAVNYDGDLVVTFKDYDVIKSTYLDKHRQQLRSK